MELIRLKLEEFNLDSNQIEEVMRLVDHEILKRGKGMSISDVYAYNAYLNKEEALKILDDFYSNYEFSRENEKLAAIIEKHTTQDHIKKVLEDMLLEIKEKVGELSYQYLVQPFISLDNLFIDYCLSYDNTENNLFTEVNKWLKDEEHETYELWGVLKDKYLLNTTEKIINYAQQIKLDPSIDFNLFQQEVNEYCYNWFDGHDCIMSLYSSLYNLEDLNKLWK